MAFSDAALRQEVRKVSFLGGASIVFFVLAILLIATSGFFFRVNVLSLSVVGAAIGTIGFLYVGVKRSWPKMRVRGQALCVVGFAAGGMILCGVSAWTSDHFLDMSWDGLAYHASAIDQLTRGWNPIYDPPFPGDMNTSPISAPALNTFTKGPWIIAAAFYQFSGRIEASKAFNLIWMAASFLFALATFLSFNMLNGRLAILVSLLLALNPVSICQLFSFYVDGQLAALLAIFICLLILQQRDPGQQFLYSLLGAVIILLLNTKLTALLYVVILGGGFWLWGVFIHNMGVRKLFYALGLGGIVACGWVGYNPFVTNTLRGLWPEMLYTTAISVNTPYPIRGLLSIHKLLLSLFAQSQIYRNAVSLKIPFTIIREELKSFYYPDTRIGGFGPWFSGAVLVTIGILLLVGVKKYKSSETSLLWVVLGLISLTILTNPEAWWARYVPQFWFIPAFTVVMLMQFPPNMVRWSRFSGYFLVGILLVNSFLIAGSYGFYQYQNNQEQKAKLLLLSLEESPLFIDFKQFTGYRMRFDEWGIRYEETANLPCTQPDMFGGTLVAICESQSGDLTP